MLSYAVFKFSDYSGQITGVDWCAVDVLLSRSHVKAEPSAFEDFRVILQGYIQAVNEQR